MLNNVSNYKEKNIRDIYLNLEPYDLKLGTKFYITKNLDCFLNAKKIRLHELIAQSGI